MKNVLLPTDLTVQSLRPIHDIVNDANGQQLTIHVVHFISLPTSISDLLFISRNKPYHAIPTKFNEAFQLLRHKYQGIVKKMCFEFIFCNSSRYLNNFIEANNISAVYLLKDYKYAQLLKQSEDFLPCFNKCKVPLLKLALHSESAGEYQNFSSLLSNEQVKTTVPHKKEKAAVSYS